MNNNSSSRRSLLAFFLLTFTLAVPFWLLGLSGGSLSTGPLSVLPSFLPVSALQTVVPLIAALILVFREDGVAATWRLLARVFDLNRIRNRIWYVPVILLPPAMALLAYGVIGAVGLLLPEPSIPLSSIPVLLVLYFVGAVGEETGWTGYATDPMQDRWNALTTSIILGMVWALIHVVPLIEARHDLTWIVWWALGTIGLRVLIVWIYNNTGRSLFAAILFHAAYNTSISLMPRNGNPDPAIAGPIIAIVAAIVALQWGPRTLAQYARATRA